MDLTQWDFTQSGPLPLNGEWRFTWEAFLDPDQPACGSETDNTCLKTPGLWRHATLNGCKIDPQGYGTYCLTLQFGDRRPRTLALKMPVIRTAYVLYINGQKKAAAGKIGRTRAQTRPAYQPKIIKHTDTRDRWTIVMHVANFHYNWGGIAEPVFLGSIHDIYRLRERNVIETVFLCGVFFIMAVVHLIRFALRRDDRLSLFFSLMCMLLLIRRLSMQEILLLNVFPHLPFEVLLKLEYGTYYFAVPIIATFIRIAFKDEFPRRAYMLILVVSAACCVTVLLTPAYIFSATLTLFQLFSVYCMVVSIYAILRGIGHQREGGVALLIGGVVLFVCAINDMLYAQHLIQSRYLTGFGMLALIMAQSFLVNLRFTRAFGAVENLSAELEQKNLKLTHLTENLEQLVDERTCELQDAYQEIEALALTDPLTGLANRRNIMEQFRREEERARRGKTPFSIALLDIDDFKQVNDTHGHDIGDAVLIAVAKATGQMIREQDHVARWGGEEFIFLFPETNAEGARIVAEKVRNCIMHTHISANGTDLSVTATMGIGEYSMDAGLDACIKQADQALYQGKRNGKNQVV